MTKIFGWNYDAHNRKHRMILDTVITVTTLTCFVMTWWVVSVLVASNAVPSPLDTWNALADLAVNGDSKTGKNLFDYVGTSLRTFLQGFFLALIVAVPLGMIIGFIPLLRKFAMPVVEVLRPIAPIAWAPILIILTPAYGPMLVVFIGIFFPLLTNMVFGVLKIDPKLVEAARVMGTKPGKMFIKVIIPSSIPYLMNGIKIGLGIGWMCIVAAELYKPQLTGIGYYLADQATQMYWPGAYAAIAVIAALGLLTTGVAELVQKAITKRMGLDMV